MVLNNIEKLLEKYENGETTLKEEQVLKHYFLSDTVAPHLEHYKPMFAYFSVSQQEQFTKDIPLKTTRKFNYKWIAVAAVAVVMLGFYLNQSSNNTNELGTYEDPELAFNEFSKSMELISKKFNQGASTVGYLKEVDKGASALNYLNEIENTTSIIFKN
ncbi:hypothetical protein [Tamlana crocina]|uniref:Anti-sigma factor n=1 Tax=Tamlana crocina TaxID=393006 RepID=A0ABX1DGU0_9FLAO|nr:hypothetical protein [Tamlana crocina]NJX16218.1 hypothetical protein [Tamlana crocina]